MGVPVEPITGHRARDTRRAPGTPFSADHGQSSGQSGYVHAHADGTESMKRVLKRHTGTITVRVCIHKHCASDTFNQEDACPPRYAVMFS